MHYYETCPFIICTHNYANVTNNLGQVGSNLKLETSLTGFRISHVDATHMHTFMKHLPIHHMHTQLLKMLLNTLDEVVSKICYAQICRNQFIFLSKWCHVNLALICHFLGLSSPILKAMDPIYGSRPIGLRKLHWTLGHGSSSKVALKVMRSNLWLLTNKIEKITLDPMTFRATLDEDPYGSRPMILEIFIELWTMDPHLKWR
jgi:hypothetical protein